MKVIFLLFLLGCGVFGRTPAWINSVPQRTDTYYYRIGQATGKTENEAIRNAYKTVLRESADAIEVNFDSKANAVGSDSSFRTAGAIGYKLSVNKVCQYVEDLISRNGYRAFVLCQVGIDPRIRPEFRTFNCRTGKEN